MSKKKFSKIVKSTINDIAKYVPGESSIDNDKNTIKLSSNESPFKIPNKTLTSTQKLISDINLYPDGDSNLLKKSIEKKFKISKNQIICGNGSDDILSVICQTFGTEKSEVICSEYGFIYYPIISKIAGAKVITAKTKNLEICLDNIINSISKKTKIIFIANPNNPTGTIILKNKLKEFLKKIPDNVIIVVDGAYSEYVIDKRYTDGIDLVRTFPNLIVTRTFSKIYALAGLRLGWAYSSENIIELLEKVRGPFNVNLIAQNIGSMILNDNDFLKRSIRHNLKWQKILPDFLKSQGLNAYETYANFILVKVKKGNVSKKKIISGLKKNKVIVRDLENYGLNEYFRVSIGTNKQMNFFMKIIKKIIKDSQ